MSRPALSIRALPAELLPSVRQLLVCAGALLASRAVGRAQELRDDARPQDAQPAATDERARDLNRVLYLGSGTTIRGRSHWIDDHWEYRRDGAWIALPAEAVERVVDERSLLAEAKDLERKVGRDEWARRVALADWMWHAGLIEESFEQLDRVFSAQPDQADALRLLRAPPSKIHAPGQGLPADDAVRQAAQASLALTEYAIANFATREDGQEIEAKLKEALVSYSTRMRVFAARALRRLHPGSEVRQMLSRAVLDGADCVRREAALALRDVGDEGVILPVVRTLGSNNAAVRANAADALGEMGYPAAVMPLMARLSSLSSPAAGGSFKAPASYIFVGRQIAYVQDYDVEVAQFAAVGDPQINTLTEGSVLDVRVIGTYETSTAIESRHIRSALHDLTGADPGSTNRSWMDWWDQNKSKYDRTEPPKGPVTRSN
jgi:hypothetical protein